MRYVLLALLLAACDNFAEVQKKDSIEAYEAWLKDNGEEGSSATSALTRLEELYRARAVASKKAEDFEAYLGRFPKSKARADMLKGKETALFDAAENAGTEAAWQAFIDRCKDCDPRKQELANAGILAAKYAAKLTIAPVREEPVNLARDPKGPKNGIAWRADVTNNSDKTLSLVCMTLVFRDAAGGVAGRYDAALAAPQSTSRMPIAPGVQKPLAPGETRTWEYTNEAPPAGSAGAPKLVVARVKVADAP